MLTRLLHFELNKEMDMVFRGVDSRGIPFSYLKTVSVAFNDEKRYKPLKGEPYLVNMTKKDKMKLKF